jgi:hypothetical protein
MTNDKHPRKIRRARASKATPAVHPPTDEDIARADKQCDPPIACAAMAPSSGRDPVAMIAPAAVERLGAALVDLAIDRLRGLYDPDRGVALVNAYIALVAIDGRARV